MLLLGLAAAESAMAQDGASGSSVFLQAGTVGSTRAVTAGVTSDWGVGWALGPGRLGGYWEASIAQWSYKASGGGDAQLTQLGLKPAFRYRFADGGSPWFVEAGVGLTMTNRRYVTDRKQFSTRFNFGDHLALGRNFGDAGRHEIALRVEHFSNGGYREPNPGENFLELRYAYRFR